MAPIYYEEVVLRWEGSEFTVQPDFRMAQRIEARGISIIGVIQSMGRGEPQMTQVAEIIAHMLQSCGAKKATPDRVYAHLVAQADTEELEWISAALTVFVPRERSSEFPEVAGPKKKKRAKKG